MEYAWERCGLLAGSLAEAECSDDGRWLVGDLLPDGHPGKSTVVKYKSWVARPGKYAPGAYPFKNRTREGLWEHVLLMSGAFTLLKQEPGSDRVQRIPLTPGRSVEVAPDTLRSWELPTDCTEARGVTILWDGRGVRGQAALSSIELGFRFESWTGVPIKGPLQPAFGNFRLNVRLVEVFRGTLLCYSRGSTVVHQVNPGGFMYSDTRVAMIWKTETPDTCGTILYRGCRG